MTLRRPAVWATMMFVDSLPSSKIPFEVRHDPSQAHRLSFILLHLSVRPGRTGPTPGPDKEINHGYINVYGSRYTAEIRAATSRRERWVDKDRGARYYGGNAAFHEYMNWGLVSLRIIYYAPQDEQADMLERVVRMMVNARGFSRFRGYNDFLVDLYRNREANTTVADLYPQIIAWFAANN